VPSVAEVVAPSGTDPVTTQSATPVAVQGAPEQGPAEEAESTESGSIGCCKSLTGQRRLR
jgi:hypothetical protein